MEIFYPVLSVLIVSLISVLAGLPFLIKKKVPKFLLMFLLSLSVGVLLSTVFLHFIPEIVEKGYDFQAGLVILLGFFIMFILEKLVHWHHSKKTGGQCGHGHGYSLAPINLIGDGIHNFLDGLVIAGAYSVNIAIGFATTIAVIFHEVPQEIADFGVLLYSGMSKFKALLFNFLSAATAIVGVLIGIVLVNKLSGFTHFIIPFAAGNFLYIAASNLLPELHRHCKIYETLQHLFAIVLGITIVLIVSITGH